MVPDCLRIRRLHGHALFRRDDCFVMRVRKDAADASILVVNHHLLFADLEARMMGAGYDGTAVLPPFHHIVFDEAHAIEAAATSFFSENFTRFKLNKQLGVFFRSRRNFIGGHLPALERLSSHSGEIGAARAAIETIRNAFQNLEDFALRLLETNFTWRLCAATERDATNLFSVMEELRQGITAFAGIIRTVLEGIDDDYQDEQVVWESNSRSADLNSLVSSAPTFRNGVNGPSQSSGSKIAFRTINQELLRSRLVSPLCPDTAINSAHDVRRRIRTLQYRRLYLGNAQNRSEIRLLDATDRCLAHRRRPDTPWRI